ncbi:sugar kinase [Celerinatantimonas sp. YJH-8]|uniref:sugar kinase n=1 Tax=Celerinatantimonas sp. YJH-8 TaxID=3228714 RepID=UPI0038C8A945
MNMNDLSLENDGLDVVTFGEAMAMFIACTPGELATVEQFVKKAAGAELNVAVGLARLGLQSGWMSRLGDDSLGQFIQQTLAKAQINHEAVVIDRHYPTGFQLKSKTQNGTDPIVEYFRKGSAASRLSIADFNQAYFTRARHLHLTGVAAALSESSFALCEYAARWMRQAGKSISFDPNLRPSLWPSEAVMVEKLNQLACLSDIVLPGISEGERLTGYQSPEQIANFYLTQGVQIVIVKTGAKGAYYQTIQGDQGVVSACVVDHVVDTVGAGDGFAVGVISALLEGLSVREAAERGNYIGARAIRFIGDSEGLPTREELNQEMASALTL